MYGSKIRGKIVFTIAISRYDSIYCNKLVFIKLWNKPRFMLANFTFRFGNKTKNSLYGFTPIFEVLFN